MKSPIFFYRDNYVIKIVRENNNHMTVRVRKRTEKENKLYTFKKAPNNSAVYRFKGPEDLNMLVLDVSEFGKSIILNKV